MRKEILVTVEYIPYKTRKQKKEILKEYRGKANIKIDKGYIYVEKKSIAS